ncbi:MAG: hypothetical protein ACLR7M_06145, partial [Varibaculum timonense]
VKTSGKNAVTFTFGVKKDLFRNVKGYTITDVCLNTRKLMGQVLVPSSWQKKTLAGRLGRTG